MKLKTYNEYLSESVSNEALTSKKPNEVETIELDMAWDSSNPEEDKAAKASFKKYKITVKGATTAFDNGQPGTYKVTGKKKDILAYLQSEFYDMDVDTVKEYYPELLEANSKLSILLSGYGTPAGLSKAETKKVAETLAKAISKKDGVKCTVNLKTLEEDSFDLDVDGEEYEGGSYNIYNDESVRNMAAEGEKYGTVKSTVEDFIKGLKKPVKEATEEESAGGEVFEIGDFIHFKKLNKTGMVTKISGDKITIKTPQGPSTGDISDVQVLYQDNDNVNEEKELSLTQETIQKKRALDDKKDELIKKLKDAGENDDAKVAKLTRLQIKKIQHQTSILLIDEAIKEMTKK